MPRVSVVIPAYNCQEFIAETVESVLSQTYSDYEIIVVDDGSSDRTAEILQGYSDRVRYVFQENSGVSVARNRALAMSSGEFIAFLDHDDLWLPEKLERQVAALDSNREAGLVYSNCYVTDMNGATIAMYADHNRPFRGNVFRELFINDFIPIMTVVARRSAIDAVGPFKVGWDIVEDHDLLLRIARTYPVEYLSLPLAKHRRHGGNMSLNADRVLEENLMLAESFLASYPELRSARGKRLTIVHSTAAYQYLELGHLAKARNQFLNAVKAHPLEPRVLSYYFLSLLGFGAIQKVRALKRALTG